VPPETGRWRRELGEAIRRRRARVAVLGLGQVGLVLLVELRRAGFDVVGVDPDTAKLEMLAGGRSYLSDVPSTDVADLERGQLSPDARPVGEADVVVMCVPTPLTDGQPDLGAVREAAEAVGRCLRPGVLVVLESTVAPGTTEELVRPLLEASGLEAGVDFALAHAPERFDSGRGLAQVASTPRVVGGLTSSCTALASAFYRTLTRTVHEVPSPREAEMAKLIENTFRQVNIALANELAVLARGLGVDVWHAMHAAATKPFGYLPFWPGPGVGGRCIDVAPVYLAWGAARHGEDRAELIQVAQRVNARMPAYVAGQVIEAIERSGGTVRGARVLGVGVAYKANVGDCRDSPGLAVLERLAAAGARVAFHDPHAPTAPIRGRLRHSRPLTAALLRSQDCVVVLVAHAAVDLRLVTEAAPLVFDTTGATHGIDRPNVVRL
jgi:UDP-N-acetyl-D-glucosamine dehydrogenase